MNREILQEAIQLNPNFTETRKASLFSNFSRLEDINPEGYLANIIAWREVLDSALRNDAFADRTCISASTDLVKNLNDRKNGLPLCLDRVLDDMVADGSLMPISQYEKAYPAAPEPHSLISLPFRAVGWAFGRLNQRSWVSADNNGNLKSEKYVNLASVKTNADKIVRKLTVSAEKNGNSAPSQVFNREQVRDLLDDELSDLDIRCCLAMARSNGQVYFDANQNVVKLIKAGPIDDTDVAITNLRAQLTELNRKEEALTSQIAEHERTAREKIKTNRKSAKAALQKKQLAEQSLDRTLALMDQLETVLQKIDNASDNKQAIAALKSSSEVLAQLNRNTNIEMVDGLAEDLQDAMADTNEVTSSLADLHINKEMEDLDLDEELEQLAEEEQAKKLSAKIPHAPKHKPAAASEKKVESARKERHSENLVLESQG